MHMYCFKAELLLSWTYFMSMEYTFKVLMYADIHMAELFHSCMVPLNKRITTAILVHVHAHFAFHPAPSYVYFEYRQGCMRIVRGGTNFIAPSCTACTHVDHLRLRGFHAHRL